MARRFWPQEDPIGRRIKLGSLETPFPWLSVIGIVADTKHQGLASETNPEMYVPYQQYRLPGGPVGAMFLVVHTDSDPRDSLPLIRREVLALDPNQPIVNVQTMGERLAESISQRRFNALLLSVFAMVALALAAVGIYGVMSYAVTQRTHEIGVRMTLGAQRADVLKLILRQSLILTLTGMGLGLCGALALTRVISSLLFGVNPTDALTFTVAATLLAAVALAASLIPAQRATKVDPLVALRYE
jgi:putative ABC transport system permease protein